MGAPFAPFTAEMRDKVDILSITRTWTFTRSDQLVSGN
jgi:protein TonB